MKIEYIKKISNQYGILKQVQEDRVLIRTNNIIYSSKYSSFMFLLTNNSCIWTYRVANVKFGKSQFEDTFESYLVEIKKEDFNRAKTYTDNFKGFSIDKEDEIRSYDDLVKKAQEQEDLQLVSKVY